MISSAADLEPGTICDCQGDAIRVACGEGVIDLLEIQTDSGKNALPGLRAQLPFGSNDGGGGECLFLWFYSV